MSRRKIKIISACLVSLLVLLTAIYSDNKSSYLSTFSKNTSVTQESTVFQNQEESESIVPSVTQDAQEDDTRANEPVSSAEGAQTYKVVKVVDGDTMDVDLDGTTTRLRIIGIDTPETVDPRKPVQCFGKEASNHAKEILTNQFVTLTADESQGNTDKYGRLLRYVNLPDGSDYGLQMISQGYAHEYTYRLPYEKQADYKQAEIDARNGNRGLWSPDTCSGNK